MDNLTENSPSVNSFLAQWEPPRRALISNLFCYAVREGSADPATVVAHVRDAVKRRMWNNNKQAAAQGLVRLNAVLDSPEAAEFAAAIIARESLPPEERERRKAERATLYQREWMKRQPPTEKQIAYLRTLGCTEIPRDRLQASQMIDDRRTKGIVWP